MWKTTTTKKIISKKLDKGMDSVFDSMNTVFDNMSDLFKDKEEESEDDSESQDDSDLKCTAFTVLSDDNIIRITNNNGHVVIEGVIKSLKVNGVDFDVE